MPVLQNFRRGRGFRQVIEELKQPYECECSAGHSQSGLLGIHHARRAQELLLTGLTLSVIQHFTVEREPVRVFRATNMYSDGSPWSGAQSTTTATTTASAKVYLNNPDQEATKCLSGKTGNRGCDTTGP
jgi:hypothetical protein